MKTLFHALERVLGDNIDKVRILYTLQINKPEWDYRCLILSGL